MMRVKSLQAFAIASLALSLSVDAAQRNADSRDKTEKVGDVLAALEATPGKAIADVGAGEGFYTIRIARAVAPGGRVAAVDVDEKVLDTLRKQLATDNIDNVDVILGAFDDPKLASGNFDSVLVYNTYHEMTEHEAMRRAMFAALKPGGHLVIVEAIHENIRNATREAQVKEHEIAAEYVAQELTATGFQIIETRTDFLPFRDPKHKGGFWLMVARKPSLQESFVGSKTALGQPLRNEGRTRRQLV
jgi:predicted methyltransferase